MALITPSSLETSTATYNINDTSSDKMMGLDLDAGGSLPSNSILFRQPVIGSGNYHDEGATSYNIQTTRLSLINFSCNNGGSDAHPATAHDASFLSFAQDYKHASFETNCTAEIMDPPPGEWFCSDAAVLSDPEIAAQLPNSLKRPNSDYMGDSSCSDQIAKKQCNTGTSASIKKAVKAKQKPSSDQAISKDPQSIAAKNRRERISERLKMLQDLVPNGSKVDLVTMLEKAISYVKFLQLQVKVLATDEFWAGQGGGKAPDISQVKEAIDAILQSSHRNSSCTATSK